MKHEPKWITMLFKTIFQASLAQIIQFQYEKQLLHHRNHNKR